MTTKLRGTALCIEALALMRANDITSGELATHSGIDRDSCQQWLAGMAHVGLAHVVEWRKAEAGKGKRTPVYRLGAGQSVLPPSGEPRSRRMRLANLVALAIVWNELDSPCTRADLVDASGFSSGTVKRIVQRMRELRLVRVCGYLPRAERVGGVWTEQFRRGSGADAQRPAPRPQVAHCRAYYWRQKQRAANGGHLHDAWVRKEGAA